MHRLTVSILVVLGLLNLACGNNGGCDPDRCRIPGQPTEEISALRIVGLAPSLGRPGDRVVVEIATEPEGASLSAVVVFLDGLPVSTRLVTGSSSAVEFDIPAAAQTSPLRVQSGEVRSNSVALGISENTVALPLESELVTDALGTRIAVNQVLVAIADGLDADGEAGRLAIERGASIVGKIPGLRAYQLRLNTTTLAELQAAMEEIEQDPAVQALVPNIVPEDDAVEWTQDPGEPGQRASNRVEEGSLLYRDRVDPAGVAGVVPTAIELAILENGIDFTQPDFSDYRRGGVQGISLFALDEPSANRGPGYHGSVVVGVLGATLGNNGMAGLLQSLLASHGGFGISVVRKFGLHDAIASTQSAIESGVRVVNWSFSTAPMTGVRTADGRPVSARASLDDATFERTGRFLEHQFETLAGNHPDAVIVNSGGNSMVHADTVLPARLQSSILINVGYHDNSEEPVRHQMSNYGPSIDLAASGVVRDCNGEVAEGSSVAAPLVTATIAAMLSINPQLTASEIRHLLRSSALPIGNEVEQTEFEGRPPVAEFTRPLSAAEVGNDPHRLGKGARLNVEGAIQAALDSLPTRQIAYFRGPDQEGRHELLLTSLDTRQEQSVAEVTGPLGPPAWSPDGRKLAVLVQDGLTLVDLEQSPPEVRKVVTGLDRVRLYWGRKAMGVPVLSWSPDGEWIAFPTDTGLEIIRPDGSGRELISFAPAWDVAAWDLHDESGPAWSPDGRMLAFTRTRYVYDLGQVPRTQHNVMNQWWPMNGIVLHDFETGTNSVLTDDAARCDIAPAFSSDGKEIRHLSGVPYQIGVNLNEPGDPPIYSYFVLMAFSASSVATEDGARTEIVPGSNEQRTLQGVGWSPQGDRAAVVYRSEPAFRDQDALDIQRLVLANVESGQETVLDTLTSADSVPARLTGNLSWSRNGRFLAVGYEDLDGFKIRFWVMDGTTAEPDQTIVNGQYPALSPSWR